MPSLLSTPIVISNEVNKVQITAINNQIEQGFLSVEYILLMSNGTPYRRGDIRFSGYDVVKALYAELDALIATGKTFEVASAELLYSKVLASL